MESVYKTHEFFIPKPGFARFTFFELDTTFRALKCFHKLTKKGLESSFHPLFSHRTALAVAMIAKLCPPHYDKNYSFQVINISREHRDAIVACFQHPLVKKANPFLQGDSADWVMVEFWVKDLQVIQEASGLLARKIGIESFEHGAFTRKDLGLE